jgi:acetyl-CoA carboxylase carboxyl transferase subunit alpha
LSLKHEDAGNLARLEDQIRQLREVAAQHDLDVGDEVRLLEEKADRLRAESYRNLTAVERVQLARHPKRPFTLDYIDRTFTDFMELHGDRSFRDDEAIVCGWARLDGRSVMVMGHQKGRDMKENLRRNFGMPHPEGYRKSLRLMRQAEKFGQPIITLIDTPGAYPGLGAEERGQAEAIATNLREMARLRVPVIAVVIGVGGSGGALALGVADRVLMLENAIYSVASPEASATILWKDVAKASEAAETMKITALDLYGFGMIDGIIGESSPAHEKPRELIANVGSVLRRHIGDLHAQVQQDGAYDGLLAARYDKFRRIGAWTEQA